MNGKLKLIIVLAITVIIGGCGSSTGFLSQAPPDSPDITMDINGFKAYATSRGLSQYRIQADTARLLEEKSIVEMQDIQVTLFEDKTGKESGTLTANTGYFYYRDNPQEKKFKNNVDLKGDIRFEGKDGSILTTPEVHYDSREEIIYSNAGFEKRRVTPDQIITMQGKAFQTDRNLKKWEYTGAETEFESRPEKTEKEPS